METWTLVKSSVTCIQSKWHHHTTASGTITPLCTVLACHVHWCNVAGAIGAASACLVSLGGGLPPVGACTDTTGEWQLNKRAVAVVISTVAANVTQLAASARSLAALMETPALTQNLLASTRATCTHAAAAMSAMADIAAARTASPDALYASARDLGNALSQVLQYTHTTDGEQGRSAVVSYASQEVFNTKARTLQQTVGTALVSARTVAGSCSNVVLQRDVIVAAKALARSAAQVVACAAVVAAVLDNRLCSEQLWDATTTVDDMTTGLARAGTNAHPKATAGASLKTALQGVKAAVKDLEAFAVPLAPGSEVANDKSGKSLSRNRPGSKRGKGK
eukprot:m.647664 g.647664  ORF g.647664 m.647664 type:complete len:336 (+) comp22658_c2_seq9:183-1190(+)